jgi:hypothetical protein
MLFVPVSIVSLRDGGWSQLFLGSIECAAKLVSDCV